MLSVVPASPPVLPYAPTALPAFSPASATPLIQPTLLSAVDLRSSPCMTPELLILLTKLVPRTFSSAVAGDFHARARRPGPSDLASAPSPMPTL